MNMIFIIFFVLIVAATVQWWISKAILWAVNVFIENDFPYDWQHTLAVFIGLMVIGSIVNSLKSNK